MHRAFGGHRCVIGFGVDAEWCFCRESPKKADRRWWSKLPNAPVDFGRRIRQAIPSARYLFWVDFTADQVEFP